MPRQLGDVLHYLIPEAAPPSTQAASKRNPLVIIPIEADDPVRSAISWNLAFELARTGKPWQLIIPDVGASHSHWPLGRSQPPSVPNQKIDAHTWEELEQHCAANPSATGGASNLAALPPDWIRAANARFQEDDLLLLFATPDTRNLMEQFALAKSAATQAHRPQLGLCIYAAKSRHEAELAFHRFHSATQKHLEISTQSYGMLFEEVQIYRAIVEQQPVGLSHPHSLASKALRNVAALIASDWKE